MSFPNLSAIAVRQRAVTLFFLILAILAGLYAFLSMGRAEDPAFTVRAMVVQAFWPGATPDEMQTQVVDRLEKRLQEVEHLYRIETTIRPGQASLIVEFQEYAPKEQVPDLFYQVRKRMQDEAGKLPTGVIGPIVDDDFGDVYFSLIALTAPGLPMRELTRELEPIRDRAMLLPGVRKALILGERTERVFIEFDNARLTNLGISPQAIFTAIDAHNRLLPAGHLETQGPRLYLRLDTSLPRSINWPPVPSRSATTCSNSPNLPPTNRAIKTRPAIWSAHGVKTACCWASGWKPAPTAWSWASIWASSLSGNARRCRWA